MNFERHLYESGLTAQGSYDKMDQYDQEAIIRFAELIIDDCITAFQKGECVKNHFGMVHGEKDAT